MSKRNSAFDELLGLPWWLGLILGIVAYVALKFILPNIQYNHPILNTYSQAGRALAGLVAIAFAGASALSLLIRMRKRRLVESQASMNSVRKLSWREFEGLVSEAFRRQGYAVRENKDGAAKGGVDLVLTSGAGTTLVRCRDWMGASASVGVVRELFGVVTTAGADRGIVICSGRFSHEAKAFARKSGIQLIGGTELRNMIAAVQKDFRLAGTLD